MVDRFAVRAAFPFRADVMFGHRVFHDFRVPQTINLSIQAIAQFSLITKLPLEILVMVMLELDEFSQIAFALTCKSILRAATVTPMKIAKREGQQVLFYINDMLKLLKRVQPRLPVTLRFKRDWHRCFACILLRPTAAMFWLNRRPEGLTDYDWIAWIASWSFKLTDICPLCEASRQIGVSFQFVLPPAVFQNRTIEETTDPDETEAPAAANGVDNTEEETADTDDSAWEDEDDTP